MMPELSQIFGLISKGGPPAIVLALLYGLSMLIREYNNGRYGERREADLTKRLGEMQMQLDTLQAKVKALECELEGALDAVHTIRFQRDEARIRVQYLEMVHGVEQKTVWPPDTSPAINPTASSTALPPVDTLPPIGGQQ